MTTNRRLAAILAADVAGYSRLMAADTVGTLAALKAVRREVVDPSIAEHKGRIVKTTGDGMLVEFGCEWATRSLQKGDTAILLSGLIVNAVCGGRHAEARDAVNRLRTIAPNFRVSFASQAFPTTPEFTVKIAEALKAAGVPD